MSRRLLVIGGAGFLGRVFANKASVHHEVVIWDSQERLARPELRQLQTVRFAFGVDSARNLDCTPEDVAVIFSWRGYPAAHEQDPIGYLDRNLTATMDLMLHLAASGVREFHYASTGGAIYGNTGMSAVKEEQLPSPVGFYGIGKLTAEMYIRKIAAESGARHFIYRMGNAYGPGQIEDGLSVGLIARAVESAMSGAHLPSWGGQIIRKDYIHAEDVARAMLSVVEARETPSGIYNVGSGTTLTADEIVKQVEKVLARAVHVTHHPARPFDVRAICLDSSKLQRATGWVPQWRLPEGIADLKAAFALMPSRQNH